MTGAEKDNSEETNLDEKAEMEKRTRQREEEICDLFYLFDRDRSGEISLEELSKVMVQFGGLSKDEIDVMLLEADIDGDGKVLNIFYHKNISTLQKKHGKMSLI